MSLCRLMFALATCLAIAAPAWAQTNLKGADGDGFYIPPPLPDGPLGSLIWTRPLEGTMALPSAARNILAAYRSVDDKGRPIAVSGTIAIPQGKAPKGGWPVITWTHGTTGLNAICAPSRDTANGPEHAYIETIRTLLDGFVKKGYAVVASDYAGLGIAGFHPFLQGVPTGRNALDMLRAARAVVPEIGKRYAVMGHSQGGQVDLFAASMGRAYLPDFTLVGNVAFAPGSQISDRLDAVMSSGKAELSLPYVLYTLQSYATTDRRIDLRRILMPQALRHLPDLHVQCMTYALTKTYWATAIAKDQFVRKPDIAAFGNFASLNEPGRLKITAPTLIVQGTEDVTVFPQATDALARQLCAGGNVLSYKPVADADHNGSMTRGAGLAQDFIDARFAGKKPPNDCKALPKAGK
ncbi:MAG: alpha/beta fold hydrolase [Pseudorhodoplanes sp.]